MSHFVKRMSPDRPLMIMMCGLPGSGKSTYAKDMYTIPKIGKPVIHSSDALRAEMFGDEATQGDNQKLFAELHRRIKDDLRNGLDVIYDATNIKKRTRIQFLKELSQIKCEPICIIMATTYEACVENNLRRERQVPEEVIKRMRMNWNPPHYSEGFSDIKYVFLTDNVNKYSIKSFFDFANNFDQENDRHTLTLGEHCIKAAIYIQEKYPGNFNLLIAALLHDNGKLHTKTRLNTKGIDDGNCHYYQHHCVGAYNSMFCLKHMGLYEDAITYISNLIYYHMHPLREWKQSGKALKRDTALLGEDLYKDILILHEADVYAH